MTDSGAITTVTAEQHDTTASLSATVVQAFQIPEGQQEFLFNEKPIPQDATFQSTGIGDGDLIIVNRKPLPNTSSASNNDFTMGRAVFEGSGNMLDRIRNDPTVMNPFRQRFPEMYERLQRRDPQAELALLEYFQSAVLTASPFLASLLNQPGRNSARNTRDDRHIDPMSIEGQRAIEAQIRKENISQNMAAALEHNPESFGAVVMLYLNCKINVTPNVIALIDRYVTLCFCYFNLPELHYDNVFRRQSD